MLKKVVQLKKRMISVQYFSDDPMNLKNYIRSGQCDQGTVHVFLSQVASALHYLHTQHIVYGNLCAENVTVVDPHKVISLVRFTYVTLQRLYLRLNCRIFNKHHKVANSQQSA